MNADEFPSLMMGEFTPDPLLWYFRELVREYDDRCESYDRAVCSGNRKGVAMPQNPHEAVMINRNAREVRDELLSRARCEHPITAEEAATYWREAIRVRLTHRHEREGTNDESESHRRTAQRQHFA